MRRHGKLCIILLAGRWEIGGGGGWLVRVSVYGARRWRPTSACGGKMWKMLSGVMLRWWLRGDGLNTDTLRKGKGVRLEEQPRRTLG